eukprot:COSAG06_NODE_331_length_17352_cov_63.031098_4_plen_222_part_00
MWSTQSWTPGVALLSGQQRNAGRTDCQRPTGTTTPPTEMSFCPVPHTTRDQAWLAVGAGIGALAVYCCRATATMRPSAAAASAGPANPSVLKPTQVIGPSGLFMKSDMLQIDEHVGNVATGTAGVSVAHVRTKGPCDEHAQTPGFDEYVLVLKGKMVVDVGPVGKDQTKVEAVAGETLWLPKGVRYHYHFPAAEGTEYVPICFPAFSPDIAGREEDGPGAN